MAKYKNQTYVCTVEAAAAGEGVAFVLADGKRYKSENAGKLPRLTFLSVSSRNPLSGRSRR